MSRPLTVAIAALYTDSASGLGTYTRELLAAVAARDDAHRYVVFLPHGATPVPGLSTRRVSIRLPLRSPRMRFFLWEQMGVPVRAAPVRPDVVHWLHPGAPLWPGRAPMIVTVCDATPWRDRRYAEDRRMRAYAAAHRFAIRRADRVITISEHSRAELASVLRTSPADIARTYLAAPRRPAGRPPPPQSVQPPYLLFLGGSEVRKNPLVAVGAFTRARIPEAVRLIVAGPLHTPGPVHADVRGAVDRLAPSLRSRVVLAGEVDDLELASLYAHAAALLYPSEREGFGLPLLEAMALGTPVIAADATSLPEVAGDAAILVAPRDAGALALAIERVVGDPSLAEDLRRRGRARVQAFAWERTAEETVASYEAVAASGR